MEEVENGRGEDEFRHRKAAFDKIPSSCTSREPCTVWLDISLHNELIGLNVRML